MTKQLKIHPLGFIKAMSSALELSSNGISKHHKKTAIICYNIGKFIQLPQAELQVLIYSALLHDIGAAANWTEKHYIIHNDGDLMTYRHAEEGYNILKDSTQLGMLAIPIRYHHDYYCGNNPSGLVGEEIPLLSRIIHLADRIEVNINNCDYIFTQRTRIVKSIVENKAFDPKLVEVFIELSKREYFWLDIVNDYYYSNFFNDISFFGKFLFNVEDMIVIAKMFSKIVDATSHYTAAHSENVAAVASFLARKKGFCEDEINQFYLAGLLHDLGKLSIPNDILNKPAELTSDEMDIIKQHPYYSHRILEQVEGFENIALWVSTHHETLDGKGYPYKMDSMNISLGGRILAVADVFSALIEERPYRTCLTRKAALVIMDGMVADLKLDGNIVNDLRCDIDDCVLLINKDYLPSPLRCISY